MFRGEVAVDTCAVIRFGVYKGCVYNEHVVNLDRVEGRKNTRLTATFAVKIFQTVPDIIGITHRKVLQRVQRFQLTEIH